MEINDVTQQSIDDIANAFAALGQPSRLKVVRLLLSAYPKGLPVGEIQKELGIAGATLSHHLDKLRQVGIVTSEKDRQWIWYSVREKALTRLLDFLFEECCTRNHVVSIEHIGQAISGNVSQSDCCD
ncbi:MAG: metalloregulator ArsR/SmtB family transcription factor [Cyanobacteria bacterium P01_F01_bin.53]